MAGWNPGNGTERPSRTKIMAEINVTPMVDVMLVLLVIFMVTAPLLWRASRCNSQRTPRKGSASPTSP